MACNFHFLKVLEVQQKEKWREKMDATNKQLDVFRASFLSLCCVSVESLPHSSQPEVWGHLGKDLKQAIKDLESSDRASSVNSKTRNKSMWFYILMLQNSHMKG